MTRSSTLQPATTLRKTSRLLCLGALVATTQLAGCGDSSLFGRKLTPAEQAALIGGVFAAIVLGSNRGGGGSDGGGSTCGDLC